MPQYCPYIDQDTDEEFSLEHIVPRALGCPDAFSISVSRGSNSKAGSEVDAPLINSPWIEAERQRLKLTSYGGALPNLVFQGTVKSDSGKESKAVFRHDFLKDKTSYEAVENRFEVVSPEDGRFNYSGNPAKAEEVIRKKIAREKLAIGEDQIQELLAQIPAQNLVQTPLHVEQTIHIDEILHPFDRCFVKMALATGFRVIGEKFARSADASLLRQFMWETESEIRADIPIRGAIYPALEKPKPYLNQVDRHLVAFYRDGNALIFYASLFGKYAGCLLVSADADSFQWLPRGRGLVWVIEPASRSFSEHSFEEYIAGQVLEKA